MSDAPRPPVLVSAALILLFGIIVFPIAWMVLTAFKQPRDVYSLTFVFAPTLENFITVFQPPWNIGRRIVNSLLIAGGTLAIAIPAAILAAYSFSRFQFMFKRSLFFLVLATQFVPAVVVILPFYLMFRDLGLLDTRIGLIIVNLAIVTPFAIWMLKGFFDAVPVECDEAALIDGASRLDIIRMVIVPMAMPGIIVASVFCFILTWNEFIFALILARDNAVTLQVGLVNFRTERGDLWELMAAAGVFITVPAFIAALSIQKHFEAGLTGGAVK
ncbi:MAG TPA: carbohydrate ABC transporter permease [Beijerinckiaceae bacterium]|nr:carbohydrate ABC transporter permease [Beijerinckiaceae bacterium]